MLCYYVIGYHTPKRKPTRSPSIRRRDAERNPRMFNLTIRRRWLLLGLLLLAIVGCVSGPPVYHSVRTWLQSKPGDQPLAPGFADDASHLNNTPVAHAWKVPEDPDQAVAQLREVLQLARTQHLGVSIAGARHSMGGHSIYPDGIVLDMLPFHHMQLDDKKALLRVGAGARWADIIPYLDARGFSVAIMQSNNDFSVGGSLSVNCHGWQQNQPPIDSSVESLRLLQADGSVVRCSREANAELFSLALGGYGLFGVILEAELRVVPNERYHAEVEVMHSDRYVQRFREKIDGADNIGMAYGRLCVIPGDKTFLHEAILTVFRKSPCRPEEIPVLKSPGLATIKRDIFRAQIGSKLGKELRWTAEKTIGEQLAHKHFSRNQLLNEGAGVYEEHREDHTDILHEYFIPAAGFDDFLVQARQIIPRHHGELLNVTIRNVLQDKDSFLHYAERDMFSFVMLFNMKRTEAADEKMAALTRDLIDAAIGCGGRHYLPYRLHATREQFYKAYPQAAQFFELKKKYDPVLLFRNKFYLTYADE
jgi:FAD/FMN-containing dehydrogenase